jgi:hypothetical protein
MTAFPGHEGDGTSGKRYTRGGETAVVEEPCGNAPAPD